MTAIITLNYNQNDYTLTCVESILKLKKEDFKLVLVENGSSKKNVEDLVSRLPKDERICLHILENNVGYVGGVNYGLKAGMELNPEFIMIMNNDTIIDEFALDKLVKCCKENNKKSIVTGKVYHYDDPNRIQDIGYEYANKDTLEFTRLGLDEIDTGQFETEVERNMIDDIFWLFPKELFEKIGGYSDYFWFNAEQVDFGLRAQREGYRLVYNPKAKLWHKGSVSVGGRDTNPRLVYYHVQSSLILKYIHLSKINFLKSFLKSLESTFRSSLKSYWYFFKGDGSYLNYAQAKRAGTVYFLKWLFHKKKNNGYNPF